MSNNLGKKNKIRRHPEAAAEPQLMIHYTLLDEGRGELKMGWNGVFSIEINYEMKD